MHSQCVPFIDNPKDREDGSSYARRCPARLDGDEYLIPSKDQRIFGAGLKRKRVQFVAEADPSATPSRHQDGHPPSARLPEPKRSYLEVVLPRKELSIQAVGVSSEDGQAVTCPDCGQLDGPGHATSLPHLLSLPQSHPPSHLARDTVGMRYLSSYGWDPDSRQGLGAQGEGRLHPIKVEEKHNKLGVGVELPEHLRQGAVQEKPKKPDTVKGKMVTVKETRRRETKSKATAARLTEEFYGSGELERYGL